MGKIQAAVADLERRLADLKTAINEELESLPDNPKIKRLNEHCFVIRMSDLTYKPARQSSATSKPGDIGTNWSPEFHDFKDQYRYIRERIADMNATVALKFLQEIVNQGSVWVSGGNYRRSFHPQVVEYLRNLLAK